MNFNSHKFRKTAQNHVIRADPSIFPSIATKFFIPRDQFCRSFPKIAVKKILLFFLNKTYYRRYLILKITLYIYFSRSKSLLRVQKKVLNANFCKIDYLQINI